MADPIHGNKPIVVEETSGKKAYCMCGHSENLPYCDGAHSRNQTGITPIVCEIEADKKVAIRQCHRSGSLPFCDGSHKNPA